MESNRMDILNKVKAGELSVEEGARLLHRLESEPEPEEPVMQEVNLEDLSAAGIQRYQNWWLYPLWLGVGILVFSAGLMSWGYTTERFFWFYCAWLPLVLGVLVIVLAAWSRQSRWLHVRVKENKPEKSTNIKISFPLPTSLAGWFLRTFGNTIPQLREQGIAERVLPFLDTLEKSREPVVIEVNDKEGEKVQVYIV